MIKNFSDHNEPHTNLFKEHGIKNMVEFGLGQATEQFLSEVEKVTSVEFYTNDKAFEQLTKVCGPQWAKKFQEEFPNDRWKVFMKEIGPEIIKAELEVTGHAGVKRGGDPLTFDYLKEINSYLDFFKINEYDYAFVDAGIHLRGDIVNCLFQRVNIIGAHDTNDKAIYGYNRVKVPKNYRVEEHPGGCGTTFWIKTHEISGNK